jgi:hypothetical protein
MMQTILDQITWSHAAALYLGLCFGIALWWIGLCAHSDIFKGPDHKFGYNYKSAFSWILLLFFACPLLNLVTLTVTLWTMMISRLDRYKENLRKKEYAQSV